MQAMTKFIKHLTAPLAFTLSGGSMILLLLGTKPSNQNLLLTLVPLILAWFAVYSGVLTVALLLRINKVQHIRLTASVCATVSTLLLMFSALGQVSVFDVLLLFALATLSIFYLRRSWPN